MTPSLHWRISGPAHAAAVLTGLAIVAAAVTGHGELVALPLPVLLWLTVALRVDRPATTTLTAIATPRRCVEGDDVEIRLVLPADGLTYRGEILSSRPADPADPLVEHADGTSWRLRLPGWGRQTVQLMVHASTPGGALAAAIRVSVPVVVEPRGLPGTAALRSTVRRPSYGGTTGPGRRRRHRVPRRLGVDARHAAAPRALGRYAPHRRDPRGRHGGRS